MQYSSSGEWQWTRQRGSSIGDYARAVAVNVDGQVYVAGYTGGSLDGQSSSGSDDAFLIQYSSSGAWQWTRQWGSSSWDQAEAVAVSIEGKVYVAGYTGGSFDRQSSSGSVDAFLTQYSSSSAGTKTTSVISTEPSTALSSSTHTSATSQSSVTGVMPSHHLGLGSTLL
eukprot:1933424-Amphidinium_carterae.1